MEKSLSYNFLKTCSLDEPMNQETDVREASQEGSEDPFTVASDFQADTIIQPRNEDNPFLIACTNQNENGPQDFMELIGSESQEIEPNFRTFSPQPNKGKLIS
jgi:hypothetical protein